MTSLHNNLFYNTLVKSYAKRYREAKDKCYIICVPIDGSYDTTAINDKFITAHILKPSPLLKNHFVASNNKHTLDAEINGQVIRVTRGFDDKNCETINILSEEIAYNNQCKEYRILICDNPLLNSSNRRISCECNHLSQDNTSLMSFDDCEKFLVKLSPELTDSLKSEVDKFLNNQTVLPNYLNNTKELIQDIVEFGIQSFTSLSNDSQLGTAIESFVIGLCHHKLFLAINKYCERDDKKIYENFMKLFKRSINPVEFGAQKVFTNFTINPNILAELTDLEIKTTPLEKLYCLRKILDLVTDQLNKTVEDYYRYLPIGPKRDPICIMSDDLIATLICVLTTHKPKQFESEITFIQTFSWNIPQNNEFGYSLVTFEVVKEFIKSDSFYQNNKPSNGQLNRRDDRSMTTKSAHQSMSSTNGGNSPNAGNRWTSGSSSSPLDRELEKISKMMDTSSITGSSSSSNRNNSSHRRSLHSNQQRNGGPRSSGDNNSNEDDLGEFLSTLSQNTFSVGCGKQI
ncbi:ankyrin repeat domain-containing protein 27-like [Oppia nitens]|uniref:ankyrin repeat domain-containing protein 27-like n=1 Tax=Oppia nitens TaxID=1686743 RepID=UPI0023DCD1F5|nr:ankyrin repeat domain-containing protein 27-like [Oppia nitens]XP_054166985.1 ankyrin repeat domain-containing protein 27-like [Oppia nitens]